MRIDPKAIGRILFPVLLSFAVTLNASAQTKPGAKPGQKKPAPAAQKAKTPEKESRGVSIPAEQMEQYRQQAEQMIRFYENTLNFLASKSNPVKEKEIIINESYLKFFWNDKVQVEDDLDDKRLVPLYKDVQAYLSDVDFFFKRARFSYQVQNVDVKTNIDQQTYFYVTANRTLTGMTVDGDSVNSNKVRYFEINYDDSKQEVKIVSIYTTKLNEKEDLRNWWNSLSDEWKAFFGKDLTVQDGLPLAKVSHYNDTVAIVDGMKVPLADSRIYGLFLKVVDSKSVDLSGYPALTDLSPLSKLSSLVSINLSGTGATDLMPLRNLNSLEELEISGTGISSLEPLKYCTHIKKVVLHKTPFTDLNSLVFFPALESLDISQTAVTSLTQLKDLSSLKIILLNGTKVSDLSPLSALTALQLLDLSATSVSDLEPLRPLKSLQKIWMDQTPVKSLAPLNEMTLLQSVYCDNTKIGKQDAISYMLAHPGVVVIFATTELNAWWNAMPADWKKVFAYYTEMDPVPSKEQLHSLMTIDSINIEGRSAITSLAPVIQLPRLAVLRCANSGIADLTPLKDLTLLRYLDACNTQVASLEPLRGHMKLETLLADNTPLKELDPIADLTGLKLVRVDNTGVSLQEGNAFIDKNPGCRFVFQTFENTAWWKALDPAWKQAVLKQAGLTGDPDKFGLQTMAGLETLLIDQNPQIVSLQPVLYLSRLKEFRFSDTRVTTLEPLGQMKELLRLGCPKNPILDLTPIGGLKKLMELDVENTQVEDLAPIAGLLNLEVLKISGTPVKNLKSLSGMRKLQVLDLFNTRISNIDVLDQLPALKSVRMFNTKISEKKVDAFKQKHPGCKVDFY